MVGEFLLKGLALQGPWANAVGPVCGRSLAGQWSSVGIGVCG